MKKTVFTFLWTIASQIVGLAIFFVYITAIDPLRTHAGLVSRIFVVGLPVLALLLSVWGGLPGTRMKHSPPPGNPSKGRPVSPLAGSSATRVVQVGGTSKQQLLAQLAAAGVELNEAASILLASDQFTTY